MQKDGHPHGSHSYVISLFWHLRQSPDAVVETVVIVVFGSEGLVSWTTKCVPSGGGTSNWTIVVFFLLVLNLSMCCVVCSMLCLFRVEKDDTSKSLL